jgi:hypothetical protein
MDLSLLNLSLIQLPLFQHVGFFLDRLSIIFLSLETEGKVSFSATGNTQTAQDSYLKTLLFH